MSIDATDPGELVPPLFFYVVHPSKIKPGDVLYEINDRPLRGGPMPLKQARRATACRGGREGWELVPETSRVSRFVDADAELRVGRTVAPVRPVNPIVAAAAASIRKLKRRNNSQRKQDQLPLFEIPGVTK